MPFTREYRPFTETENDYSLKKLKSFTVSVSKET